MPINYGHREIDSTYTDEYYDAIDVNKPPWQYNPEKIVQVKVQSYKYGGDTITGSAEDQWDEDLQHPPGSGYKVWGSSINTSIWIQRTKLNSIFYVQAAGRVVGNPSWTEWRYDSDHYYSVHGDTGTKVIWGGTVVYQSNSSWVCWVRGMCTFEAGGYLYNTGALMTGNLGSDSTKKSEIRRRYIKESAPSNVIGVPELILSYGNKEYIDNPDNNEKILAGPWKADSNFITSSSLGPRGEASYLLSAYFQPDNIEYDPPYTSIYIRLRFRNVNDKGEVSIGENSSMLNISSMVVYEIKQDASAFIMKPDDAEFELTGGARPSNDSDSRWGGLKSGPEFSIGYGIPNHYWEDNEMVSRGIRCLIPNHNVFGEWIAFGEGYMTTAGGTTGSNGGAQVNQGMMAAMITKDNGFTWYELGSADVGGSTPELLYVPLTNLPNYSWVIDDSPIYPNEPIVYDWATNEDTSNPLWIMTGRELWGVSDSNYSTGGDLCIYRSTDFYNWDLRFAPRANISGEDSGLSFGKNQVIYSVCYSDGYFVFGNNRGQTIRASVSSMNDPIPTWEPSQESDPGDPPNRFWISAISSQTPITCLTSNDGGNKIVACGENFISFSNNGGYTWNKDVATKSDWFVPEPKGYANNWIRDFCIWNVTYVNNTVLAPDPNNPGEDIVRGLDENGDIIGVWIACGFKRKSVGSGNPQGSENTMYPLYAYSENGEHWYEIDVEKDTNLPYNGWFYPNLVPYSGTENNWQTTYTCFPNTVRERITYCKDSNKLLTWANAGPGPSSHNNFQGQIIDASGQILSPQYDSPGNDNWDSSKASLWVSNNMSLTDWTQVSAGTPFIGSSYSGTTNAPTTATILKDGKYRPQDPSSYTGHTGTPNVFQHAADGYANGRYMVGSTGGEVYNNSAGRIAFIDVQEEGGRS